MKRLVAVLAVAFFAACGSTDSNGDGIADGDPITPDSVTAVAPSSPKGKVSGQVVDSQGKPLEGVEVLLSGTEQAKTSTDANGLFAFDKVTGGSRVGLLYSKAGYAPAHAYATVPGATGNFPLNDGEIFVGPIGLLANTGSLSLHVVGYDGALVGAFQATLEVTPGFLEMSSGVAGLGEQSVAAAGADGVIKFEGISAPQTLSQLGNWFSAQYTVYVAPVMDGETVRYAGRSVSFTASQLVSEPWTHTVVLGAPYSTAALQIVATNVRNLIEHPTFARYNLVPTAGPLTIAFNQRVSPTALAEIYADQQDAADYVPENAAVEVSSVGSQLRVLPGQQLDNAFIDGHKYYLVLNATSRDNPGAAPVRTLAPFFGGVPADPKPLGAVTVQFLDDGPTPGMLEVGEKIQVVFERNVGRGESAGFSVPLYFDTDLDRSGTMGDSAGESGSDEPVCVRDAETIPQVSGAFKSGYSRWAQAAAASNVQPRGSNSVIIHYAGLPAAAGTVVKVAFSESYKCGGTLHTVWGENLLNDVQTSLVAKVPPAK